MKRKNKKSVLLKIAVMCMVFVMAIGVSAPVHAAVTTRSVVSKVKSSVNKYPFSNSDAVSVRRRRGKITIFGADARKLSAFKAYQKTTKTEEYILFVGKAKSSSKARTVKKSLKAFVKNEASCMSNYLSDQGKKSFAKAKIGSSGKWVWAIVLTSSSDNTKAEKAIKKKI